MALVNSDSFAATSLVSSVVASPKYMIFTVYSSCALASSAETVPPDSSGAAEEEPLSPLQAAIMPVSITVAKIADRIFLSFMLLHLLCFCKIPDPGVCIV